MAGRAALDGWSRLVSWLKVLLPLTALGLLSTLFLVSNRINPEDAIPYAEVDVAERLREPRMTAPTYASITGDGSSLVVTAAEARPAQEGVTGSTAQEVIGTLTTLDGEETGLVADTAVMAQDSSDITFTGAVVVTHSSGYTVRTERLVAELERTALRSTTPVQADGPAGQITADAMELEPVATGADSYLLVFNGHVKLVYQPAE